MKFTFNLLVLFSLSLISCRGMEDCNKDYEFIGYIKDSNGVPINGVDVYLVIPSNISDKSTWLTASDNNGYYKYSMTKTKVALVGQSFLFSKAGYKDSVGDSLSNSEGGAHSCGYRQIQRDIVLSP